MKGEGTLDPIMKILLLQLPLQGHDFFFSHENIPLASAGLALIAREAGFDAEVMPEPLMSYGNDQSLLKYIRETQPDVVGMSCYLWNVERSLFMAREIKKELPSCVMILGGPEITPDNRFLLKHPNFDMGVVGEGEGTWKALLRSLFDPTGMEGLLIPDRGGRWHFTGFSSSQMDLRQLPSPFLKGVLQGHLKGVLWMESVRGCVQHCTYCYYHKRFSGIKPFPSTRILQEIEMAREKGIREVVFLDPCWNRHPKRRAILDRLLEINRDRALTFYAECDVEGIDIETARLMGQAGFGEVEVGLQTIKKETLHQIHRRCDPHRFLERVQFLRSSNIEVMIDLIAGLPGERVQDILKSIHWVLEHDAYDSLMLYPLSLLPSTELYQSSKRLGLQAMLDPPYLITHTPHLSAEEMHHVFVEYERLMEEEIAPLEMPIVFDHRVKDQSFLQGLCALVQWPSLNTIERFPSLEDRLTYSLTLQMGKEVIHRPEMWLPILKDYLKRNPFSLLSIEVPQETSWKQVLPLWNLAREHSHPVERDYTVPHTPYRSLIVLSRSQGVIWKWPDPREWTPLILFDGQKISYPPTCLVMASDGSIPRWFQKWVEERYPAPPRVQRWELPEE